MFFSDQVGARVGAGQEQELLRSQDDQEEAGRERGEDEGGVTRSIRLGEEGSGAAEGRAQQHL